MITKYIVKLKYLFHTGEKHHSVFLTLKEWTTACLVAILTLYSAIGFAQNTSTSYNIEVQHWNVEDGLSYRRVQDILQDSRGFLWIATSDGLNRFEGSQFKTFTHEEHGLANDDIVNLVEDDEGWLWVVASPNAGDHQNISFINVLTNEVLNLQEKFGNSFPIDSKNLTSIITNADGTIFLAGEEQVFQYQEGEFSLVKKFDYPAFLHSYNDLAQTLLLHERTSFNDFNLIELKGQSVISKKAFRVDKNIIEASYDEPGNIWLKIDNQIKFREDQEWQHITPELFLHETDLEYDFENRLYGYNSDLLLYHDQKFLFLMDPNTQERIDIGAIRPEISRSNILSVRKDKPGNLWIGTEFGFYYVRIQKSPFTNFLNSPIEEYNVANTFSTLGISSNKEVLWINGLNGNQFLINQEDQSISEVSLKGVYPDPNQSVDPIVLYPVLRTGPNEFLTTDLSLMRYKDGKVSKVYYWQEGLFDKSWSIYEGNDQILLGLYSGGLGRIEKDNIVLFEAYNGFETLARSQTYHFLKWNDQHLLLATSTGIYVLNTEKGIVKRFWTGGEANERIPFNVIYHINKDQHDPGLLWVATAGEGLLKLHLTEDGLSIKSQEQFTVADGLANNVLYAVYPDDYGNLWLPSNYGLMKFNSETNRVNGYTTADGLPFNEFNRIAHHQSEDGRLTFGTMNGVTTFYPRDFQDSLKSFDAPLEVVEFKQFSAESNALEDRTTELLTNAKIVLEPKDNLMILNIALLEYQDASRIQYSYQLIGQSDDWIYLNSGELRLSGLAYGTYTLNIRAQGNSGEFSSSTLSIPIIARAPFYLQWWFILLSFIAVIVAVYALFRYRTRSLRYRQIELELEVKKRTEEIERDKQVIQKQASELKSLDELKSQFFANVSHELRTPLTLIVAPVQEMLAKEDLDKDLRRGLNLVNKNGRRLQGMVSEMLDLSKFESGKMTLNKEPVIWFSFLKQLVASFDSLAKSNQISYQLNFEGDDSIIVNIDKTKVETIFNNLLSNAFKFTLPRGSVTVDSGIDRELLWLTVCDSGQGISEEDLPYVFDRYFQTKNSNRVAQGGTGIGLALTRELVKFMGGTVNVQSKVNQYTEFKVTLPVEVSVQQEVATFNEATELVAGFVETHPSNGTHEKDTPLSQDTVLLVEDNPDLRLFVSSILQEYYAVVTAANGQQALEVLEANTDIKIVVSDIMMPVMDGFQLLNKLKASESYKKLPVIMLTARAALQDKLKALRIGVDDYLTKPFIKEELLARIANLLQNARGREEARLLDPLENGSVVAEEITNEETNQWLDKLEAVVLQNIELAEFSVDDIADEMCTSKRQLYRLIKENIGVTPLQYVKDYKLNYARKLLEEKKVKAVKVAAYSIGYSNEVYFRREFKKAFGCLPSDYLA